MAATDSETLQDHDLVLDSIFCPEKIRNFVPRSFKNPDQESDETFQLILHDGSERREPSLTTRDISGQPTPQKPFSAERPRFPPFDIAYSDGLNIRPMICGPSVLVGRVIGNDLSITFLHILQCLR